MERTRSPPRCGNLDLHAHHDDDSPPGLVAFDDSPPRMAERSSNNDGMDRPHDVNDLHLQMISALGHISAAAVKLADRLDSLQDTPKLPPPVLQKLSHDESIDNFLKAFERTARAQCWPQSIWSSQLGALLTGRALAAYTRLDDRQALDYRLVVKAIRAEYNLCPESYRKMFREATMRREETYGAFAHRIADLATKWLQPTISVDDHVLDQIVLEQFCSAIPGSVQTFVRETGALTLDAAIECAERFTLAHSSPVKETSAHSKKVPQCFTCGGENHYARSCPQRQVHIVGGRNGLENDEMDSHVLDETSEGQGNDSRRRW